ncbi:hypothetical protein B0T11DRAFT_287041 [Plectosphaerella cucumerina]|uniref:Uncharacterized protein n=1 Tax=Plectosphaerella cucumerina TaxID=40658 RepID=A0A8K0T7V7_9PEZI|nr:hypothetical protein B0T11DRAFT_287041 [Plectosphaerella cucumerina]
MKSTLLTLAALAGLAFAEDQKCLNYMGRTGPCLTSFAWCTPNPEPVCTTPEGADPIGNEIALYRGRKYDLSFNKAWESDSSVLVTWIFPRFNDNPGDDIRWSKNISYTGSEGTFVFDPEAILSEFPTPEYNVTQEEAIVGASYSLGYIWIQPSNFESHPLITQKFIVLSNTAGHIADAAKRAASRRRAKELKLGLGIGLGVGIPIIVILTWLVARPPTTAMRNMKKKFNKKKTSEDDISVDWVPATSGTQR